MIERKGKNGWIARGQEDAQNFLVPPIQPAGYLLDLVQCCGWERERFMRGLQRLMASLPARS